MLVEGGEQLRANSTTYLEVRAVVAKHLEKVVGEGEGHFVVFTEA